MFKKEEVLNDIKALLAGITINSKAVPVISSGTILDDDADYPAIEVDISFINPAFLADKGSNTGFYSPDIEIACTTYGKDDKTRSVVNGLLFQAQEKFNQTNLLALLNQISTYHNYIGVIAGDSFEADEERLRHEVLQFTFQIANKTNN